MADLSVLIGRGSAGFSPDTRFVAAEGDFPAAPETCRPAATATEPPPDPLALAHAEGYAQGLADARAEAAEAARTATEARTRFAFSFARLDAELAEALGQRLLETVVALCEEALAPLALDHKALAERVSRAVAMFARADDERVIRLHPDDLAVVSAELPADWTFLPDPALARGALRVETASGGVEDGPAQWRAAITEALDPVAGK